MPFTSSERDVITGRCACALPVADLPASLACYLGLLRFTLVTHMPADDLAELIDPDGDHLLLAGPRAGDLAPYLDAAQRVLEPGSTLNFHARDLSTLRTRLVADGVAVAPIVETAWGDQTLTLIDPDGFVLRLVTPAKRSVAEVLAIYVATPAQLVSLLADLSDAELELALMPGSWTIRQIVYHLADGDSLFLCGIRMALAEPGRSFSQNWPGNNAAYIEAECAGLPIAPAVALFQAMRDYVHHLIMVTPDPWERAIHDADGGEWSVRRFFDVMSRHALEHLDEIRAIRAAHGR